VVTWTVVVPVKRLAEAKSRLETTPLEARPELALAFGLDTIAAARAAVSVGTVVVATSEPRAIEALELADDPALARVQIVPDPGGGLVAALRAGLAAVRATRSADGAVGVLLGDLPALRPTELDAALGAAAAHALAMVADADGTGTTLLTGLRVRDVVPRFGPGSAAAHARAGHVALAAAPGLRRDVDTAEDLAEVVRLGVGGATTRALAALA
jgi:2-phospho-L-lactate guanylyltransferase